MNIAYTNDRCRYVSDEVRKQLGYKNTYEIGEEIICRLTINTMDRNLMPIFVIIMYKWFKNYNRKHKR